MPLLKQHAGLYTDYYELTMAQGYLLLGKVGKRACFDYFFRSLPFMGGYVIFAGLYDLLETLDEMTFESDDLEYLKGLGFHVDFLAYLAKFRFKGSIYSVKEGEIVFSNQPVLRVEGDILETQIIETLVLNILNFESLIATKASRLKKSAGEHSVIDFGLRRAQGLGGIHASRAAAIGGADMTSNVYSAFKFGLKTSGTMAHSWIESFDEEEEAFRKFANLFPDNSIFLVDTYDTLNSGIPNAIKVAKKMEKDGYQLKAIRIDSGDLAYISKQARSMLDQEGLNYVKIVASNQLDEYIIKSLLEQGAPIDVFGVGTSLVVGSYDGALDGVYKLTMYDAEPRLKVSENPEKVLLPGVKKIYRYLNGNDDFYSDAILLENEGEIHQMFHPFQSSKHLDLSGLRKEQLLNKVMDKGDITIEQKTPYEIAVYARKRLNSLPEEHKRFENPNVYKVEISKTLRELRDSLVKQHSTKTIE